MALGTLGPARGGDPALDPSPALRARGVLVCRPRDGPAHHARPPARSGVAQGILAGHGSDPGHPGPGAAPLGRVFRGADRPRRGHLRGAGRESLHAGRGCGAQPAGAGQGRRAGPAAGGEGRPGGADPVCGQGRGEVPLDTRLRFFPADPEGSRTRGGAGRRHADRGCASQGGSLFFPGIRGASGWWCSSPTARTTSRFP